MSRLHITPGTKHQMTWGMRSTVLDEPVGNVSLSLDWRDCWLEDGAILTAGLPCTYHGPFRTEEAQWFSSGPRSWHMFFLRPGQTLLEPLQDYGPMGALVVDDPSGEDVCAYA